MSRSAVKPAIRSSRAASVADDRALRHRFLHRLQIFRTRMKKEMDVGVDQSGQQRPIAEVDHLRASRMLDRRADFDDAFALNKNFPRLDDLPGL